MPFTTASTILHHAGDPHSSPRMCFHPKTHQMLAGIGTSTAKSLNFTYRGVQIQHEKSFVYEGITSRSNTNVVNRDPHKFFYPFHVLPCSFWKVGVVSYGRNIRLPSWEYFIFHLQHKKKET